MGLYYRWGGGRPTDHGGRTRTLLPVPCGGAVEQRIQRDPYLGARYGGTVREEGKCGGTAAEALTADWILGCQKRKLTI